jgi:hypothetical protein
MSKLILLLSVIAGCGGSEPVTTCDANQFCQAGHFNLCNAGGLEGCYYQTSDGSRFSCGSCGDCANAQYLVAKWCESRLDDDAPSQPRGDDSTCAGNDQSMCISCCVMKHPDGVAEAQRISEPCTCGACPACVGSTLCGGSDQPSTACGECINGGNQACLQDAVENCRRNSVCSAYLTCAEVRCGLTQ